MSSVFLIKQNNIPLFTVKTESMAQEYILSLYEEYIYEQFLEKIQNGFDAQLTLFLFNSSTYGYNIFTYERIGLYE